MKRKSMRPALFVLLALVLSAPTLAGVAAGTAQATTAGEQLAGAVVLAWLAVSTVGRLVDGYQASLANRERRGERTSGSSTPR